MLTVKHLGGGVRSIERDHAWDCSTEDVAHAMQVVQVR